MSGALLGATATALTVKTVMASPAAPVLQPAVKKLATTVVEPGVDRLTASTGGVLHEAEASIEQVMAKQPTLATLLPDHGRGPNTPVTAARPSAMTDSSITAPRRPGSLAARERTRQLLVAVALRHGVDPQLLLALSYWESGWDQSKVSVGGAVGLMQVEPYVAQVAGPTLLERPVDINNPYDNADVGAAIFKEDLDNYGNPAMALAAYYQGPQSLQQYGVLPDTQQYVQGILSLAPNLPG